MKTAPNKKIPQTSDWVQVEQESAVCNINLNLVEEVSFFPDIAGEPAISIHYASGRTREIRGEQARSLWHLVNQGVSFELKSKTASA